MNQLCRVCGEPAAGFHFGAFTCEGCKSFFGRTYSNLSSISECKNNGECVINKKNRTSCKACRLRKCLLVGMSKSGSRYGRRSNWFKIHCLLQEQQQQQQQQQQHHQQAATSVVGSTGSSHQGPKASPSPLWSTKSLSEGESPKPFHLEPKPLTTPPSPTRSATASLPQPLTMAGFPADAAASAAAFWAQARGSLLQLPSPHLSALPMPFLTPPFLHSTGFNPYQHKGFLLPFLPPAPTPPTCGLATSVVPRPARPTSPALRALPIATISVGKHSMTSSSDAESPPPSPPSPPTTRPPALALRPPPARAPPAVATAAAAAAAATAAALAVETLRALGPMQDHPLDLSIKGAGRANMSRRTNSDGSMGSGSENESSDEDDDRTHEEDEFSEDPSALGVNMDGTQGEVLHEGTATVRRTTPLDLTTHA